jgi:lipoprotein-anchoring transpeptidase ErfK/SrfK
VSVTLFPGDPTGPVSLWDGDLPLGALPPSGGLALFPAVSLPPGSHVLRATSQGEGGVVVSAQTSVYAWSVPGAPRWSAPGAKAVTSPCVVKLYAGSSTASMTLSVSGHRVGTVACRPGQLVTFPRVKLTSHLSTLTVVEHSLTGETATYSHTVRRHEFPYATCIVIDKSEFRLYWVRGQQLIKKYPIAHGRHNWTPVGVWKVLAKYKTYAKGIYGPRKMRLFRRVGSPGHYRYVFTRYGIHGTNQPWVIGTMASHGCIRMYNRDVLQLWPLVPLGTYVVTQQ